MFVFKSVSIRCLIKGKLKEGNENTFFLNNMHFKLKVLLQLMSCERKVKIPINGLYSMKNFVQTSDGFHLASLVNIINFI